MYVIHPIFKIGIGLLLFCQMKNTGVIKQIYELLRVKIVKKVGIKIFSCSILFDSQYVKTIRLGLISRRTEGSKTINGLTC